MIDLQTTITTVVQLIPIEEMRVLTEALKQHPVEICLDTETTGLNPLVDKLVSIQFGTKKRVYILDCRPFYTLPDMEKATWKSILVDFIAACPCIIGQNLKFDYKMLAAHFGVKLDRIIDTQLQELVIYGIGIGGAESNGIAVNMYDMGTRYGITVAKEARSWFIGLDTREEWSLPFPQEQIDYMVQDIVVPLQIRDFQQTLLEERDLTQIAELEHATLPAIAKMELDGCYVDREKWTSIIEKKKAQSIELESYIQAALTPIIQPLREQLYKHERARLDAWVEQRDKEEARLREVHSRGETNLAWGVFKNQGMKAFQEKHGKRPARPVLDTGPINLGSHVQLKKSLEVLLGVVLESTDEGHLAPYAKSIEVVGKLLEWKGYNQFVKTFGYSILDRIDIDGRIHPDYKQIGAATGRMSCAKPNWQNLPSHEPDETSVRRCVIAEEGNVLLTADFSNIEVRVLADISQDENLLAFFARGGDLHSDTARMMFGLSATDKELKHLEMKQGLTFRSAAKAINFGLVYGQGAKALAETLGVSLEEALDLRNKYFAAYPGVASYLEIAPQTALDLGYTKTVAGRKRFYPLPPEPIRDYEEDILDYIGRRNEYHKVRGGYITKVKNAPIQGTSADITKYALALLYRHLPDHVKMVAVVHDEVVLECPTDKAEDVSKVLSAAMFKACKKYLTTVYIPPIEVAMATYWSKE